MSFTDVLVFFASGNETLAGTLVTSVTSPKIVFVQPGTIYVRYILYGIVGFVLTIAGSTGNVLSIVVLATQSSNSVNLFLICLAVADTCFLLNGCLRKVVGTINRYNGQFQEYRALIPYLNPYLNGVAFLTHSLTVWLVVAITIDRYIAVCFPLKAIEVCTRGRAKRVVAILVIACSLFSVPRFFEKTSGYIFDPELDDEHAVLTVVYREFHSHPVYIYLYETALYGGGQFLFPLLLLITLNVRLLWALSAATRYRFNLQSVTQKRDKKDDNVSAMIVVIITVFLVCQFPNFLSYALRLLEVFDSSKAILQDPQGTNLLTPIKETLLRINSSTNFLIYMLVGKEFRRALFKVFGFSKRKTK
jgi:hypothetical protein